MPLLLEGGLAVAVAEAGLGREMLAEEAVGELSWLVWVGVGGLLMDTPPLLLPLAVLNRSPRSEGKEKPVGFYF